MEISGIRRNTSVKKENKTITTKKDFSRSFNFAQQKKSEEQLKQMQEDIKKKGNRLAITKCFVDVNAYKNLIKEYLQSVLNYMYSVKKDISFWQTQYFITVETVDKKLEELTEQIMSEEREKLNVASTIDDITGLIVDMYK
ncbi:YaaR family protein [Clostridium neuense]|uniref:YaaR family protein n=1 Tax=Clostridium neuense TaxID=1728934 RepID=A0ABW8TE33_9CLOT